MATRNNEIAQPLASRSTSNTWSGPTSGAPSMKTFNSSTATDPIWREPVLRLQRWKSDVASVIKSLREHGQEGLEIIKKQELRAVGRHADLMMSDGSPLPDDLSFWKARFEYFAQEWRKIQEKKPGGLVSMRETANPDLDWIIDWLSDIRAAGAIDRPYHLEELVYEEQSPPLPTNWPSIFYSDARDGKSSELPMASARKKNFAKKRSSDVANQGGQDVALPRKRQKRNLSNYSRTEGLTSSKRNLRKRKTSAAPPEQIPSKILKEPASSAPSKRNIRKSTAKVDLPEQTCIKKTESVTPTKRNLRSSTDFVAPPIASLAKATASVAQSNRNLRKSTETYAFPEKNSGQAVASVAPSKRSPRKATASAILSKQNEEKEKSSVAPSRRNPRKVATSTVLPEKNQRKATASVAVARNGPSGGVAGRKAKAGQEDTRTAQQPLRRSRRITALDAVKA